MKRVPKSIQLTLKIIVLSDEGIYDFRKGGVVNIVLGGLAIGGVRLVFIRHTEHANKSVDTHTRQGIRPGLEVFLSLSI